MILFPAIDLKDGACVRLKLGDMNAATVYHTEPFEQARLFEAQGFSYLHLVDLNGAFAGESRNSEAVEEILKAISIPVQLGGGLRDARSVENWLNKGVSRVILGTAAVKKPQLVKDLAKAFPGQIVVGLDAREGLVATEGWAETSTMQALDLAKRFEDAGVAAIIHTDIDRDGVLKGLNLKATLSLAKAVDVPFIASGGLASMDDIFALASAEAACLEGAISGKALYDGRIEPREALSVLQKAAA